MISIIGLIESFKDTQRMIRGNEALRDLTVKTQAGTLLYFGGYEAMNPTVKADIPVIEVTEDTTFHCAQSYVGGNDKVAVLNFANAYSPGGGVAIGAMAQEECLCRSSNLYASLTIPYILKNYYKWNSKHTGDMGTDSVIYSPGVTVFKTDAAIPEEMSQWFSVDVLTCAAPYYNPGKKRPVSVEKLEEVFRARIRNILEVAAANDVDILILGAFGCGAFNNPPAMVADVFRYLLIDKEYGRFFRKIVFAVKRNDTQNSNLLAFQNAFIDEAGDRG